jgi:hypothetical protein
MLNMEEVYVAVVVGILFFVSKLIINKIQKIKTARQDIRDSFLAAVLVGGVLFLKKTNFSKLSEKAKVFVNEPGF